MHENGGRTTSCSAIYREAYDALMSSDSLSQNQDVKDLFASSYQGCLCGIAPLALDLTVRFTQSSEDFPASSDARLTRQIDAIIEQSLRNRHNIAYRILEKRMA